MTPGPIDTPILGKMFPDKDAAAQLGEKMIGMVPMKRFGTSDEIAKAVLFLAFDATFTTGAELPVDGSWSHAVGAGREEQGSFVARSRPSTPGCKRSSLTIPHPNDMKTKRGHQKQPGFAKGNNSHN